ncbi:Hypothetical_protein [Hexamita inflata]|uniref:Hypothetical_protein n=1 Tax=Hexamita inflata TaxID=28002 RepID=A0AA86QS91_9EUKA|nr:Hypothetical protein HINF_LOCUS47467 [Hexamita inflata]
MGSRHASVSTFKTGQPSFMPQLKTQYGLIYKLKKLLKRYNALDANCEVIFSNVFVLYVNQNRLLTALNRLNRLILINQCKIRINQKTIKDNINVKKDNNQLYISNYFSLFSQNIIKRPTQLQSYHQYQGSIQSFHLHLINRDSPQIHTQLYNNATANQSPHHTSSSRIVTLNSLLRQPKLVRHLNQHYSPRKLSLQLSLG